MNNNYIDHETIAAILSTLTTWLLLIFLSYRLAVMGKKESGIPYWKSVLIALGLNIWFQGVYTLWQPNSLALKVTKTVSLAVLTIPTITLWVAIIWLFS